MGASGSEEGMCGFFFCLLAPSPPLPLTPVLDSEPWPLNLDSEPWPLNLSAAYALSNEQGAMHLPRLDAAASTH